MENTKETKGYTCKVEKGDLVNDAINNKLTDNDIDAIIKELGEEASETTKHLREIIAEGENDNTEYPKNVMNKEYTKVLANVDVDPNTGEMKLSQDGIFRDNDITMDDISEGEDIIKLADITEDNMKDSLKDMDMSDEEAMMMINAMKKVEEGKDVKYEELPFSIQQMVDGLRRTGGECGIKYSEKTVIKDILGFFKSQLAMDQEIVNLQESLRKELDIDIVGQFTKETDKMMEDKMRELADKAEESGNIEKAKELRDISTAYEDAKNFESLTKCVDNNAKCARKLDRELSRWNKHVRDFNFKYEKDTRFGIDSLENVLKVLKRHMKKYDEAMCKEFLILFCKYTQNMNPKSVVEHTYMYYTLKTIMNLDIINPTNELYKEITDKLDSIIGRL